MDPNHQFIHGKYSEQQRIPPPPPPSSSFTSSDESSSSVGEISAEDSAPASIPLRRQPSEGLVTPQQSVRFLGISQSLQPRQSGIIINNNNNNLYTESKEQTTTTPSATATASLKQPPPPLKEQYPQQQEPVQPLRLAEETESSLLLKPPGERAVQSLPPFNTSFLQTYGPETFARTSGCDGGKEEKYMPTTTITSTATATPAAAAAATASLKQPPPALREQYPQQQEPEQTLRLLDEMESSLLLKSPERTVQSLPPFNSSFLQTYGPGAFARTSGCDGGKEEKDHPASRGKDNGNNTAQNKQEAAEDTTSSSTKHEMPVGNQATTTTTSPAKGARFADYLLQKMKAGPSNVAAVASSISNGDNNSTNTAATADAVPSSHTKPSTATSTRVGRNVKGAKFTDLWNKNKNANTKKNHPKKNHAPHSSFPTGKGMRFRNLVQHPKTTKNEKPMKMASVIDACSEPAAPTAAAAAHTTNTTTASDFASAVATAAAAGPPPLAAPRSDPPGSILETTTARNGRKGARFRDLDSRLLQEEETGQVHDDNNKKNANDKQVSAATVASASSSSSATTTTATTTFVPEPKGSRFQDVALSSMYAANPNRTNNSAHTTNTNMIASAPDEMDIPIGAFCVQEGGEVAKAGTYISASFTAPTRTHSDMSGMSEMEKSKKQDSTSTLNDDDDNAHRPWIPSTAPPGSTKPRRNLSRFSSTRGGGLAEASPVEAEAIVYAEAHKDTSRRSRVLATYSCLIALAAIITGICFPLVSRKRANALSQTNPRCLLPYREQDAISHCVCRGTVAGFWELLEPEEQDFYDSLYQYFGVELSGKAFEKESCELENQALLYISNFRRHGLDAADPRLHEIPFLGEVYAIVLLYLKLDGDHWESNEGWLTNGLNVCDWFGIQCGLLLRISAIALASNRLSGSIPTEISSVSSLTLLDLSQNAGIIGQIPPGLYRTPRLHTLDLSYTNVTGQLQSDIRNLERLDFILLSNTNLTGTIPTEIGLLTSLISLKIERNLITGPIPTEIGHLSRLRDLILDRNRLTGTLPTEFAGLTHIEVLDISRNFLTGTIPDYFGFNTRLEIVDIIESGLSGAVPETYCLDEELVVDRVIIGNCAGDNPMVPNCTCCSREDFRVSLCVEDFPEDALGNA